MGVWIKQVESGSPAQRHGIEAGEKLLEINGHPIADVLDYRFYMTERRLRILLQRADGKERMVRLRKDEYEDLGLEFETYLMDRQHSCKNKCMFCFVDQMPPGMRESLYFKDDDDRLSFFFGNYITMTNLSRQEIDRIIKMRISPINISVHTTDPQTAGADDEKSQGRGFPGIYSSLMRGRNQGQHPAGSLSRHQRRPLSGKKSARIWEKCIRGCRVLPVSLWD